jgi:hypothetical protein
MSIFTPLGWYTTRQLLVGMIAVVGMGWWTSDLRATQKQDAEAWPRVITADRSEYCAETLSQARQGKRCPPMASLPLFLYSAGTWKKLRTHI